MCLIFPRAVLRKLVEPKRLLFCLLFLFQGFILFLLLLEIFDGGQFLHIVPVGAREVVLLLHRPLLFHGVGEEQVCDALFDLLLDLILLQKSGFLHQEFDGHSVDAYSHDNDHHHVE